MDALTSLPSIAIFLVVGSMFVGMTVLGLLIVWRYAPLEQLLEHNDVAGFIFAALGVIVAVIMAFLVIAVWEDFEDSRRAVDAEAAQAVELHRSMAAFPVEISGPIDVAMIDYLENVVEDEWPKLKRGEHSPATEAALERLWHAVQAITPVGENQKAWHAVAIDVLQSMTLLRDVRLYEAEQRLPPVMTVLLVVGALITLAYTYLYGVRNRVGHLLMSVALAAMIALVVSLIIMLDAPFHGDTSIKVDPIEESLVFIQRVQIE